MKEFNDKRVSYLWNAFLYVSIFFLMFFLMYGFKSVTGNACTSQNVNNPLGVSTLSLTNNNTLTFPVEIPSNKDQNIYTETLCLQAYTNTSSYLGLVHNEQTIYLNNETVGYQCFNNANRTNNEYIFYCNDCDVSNAVIIGLSSEEQIIINGDTVSKTNNVHYLVSLREYCQELFKVFVNIYFSILGLFVFLFLLIRALDWFKRWIFW